MDITNWKKTSEKIVHKNPHFQIHEEDLIRPDGSKTKYYVMDRYAPFAIVIPIDVSGKIFLVHQYRVPVKQMSWEFPMGGVIGKEPLDIAKQELKEELGMTAATWMYIGLFHVANGFCSQKGYVFIARELTKGKPQPEPGEFIEWKLFSIHEIEKMIKNGRIKDSPSITSFYFFTQQMK